MSSVAHSAVHFSVYYTFSICCVFGSRCLVTASNSVDPSNSVLSASHILVGCHLFHQSVCFGNKLLGAEYQKLFATECFHSSFLRNMTAVVAESLLRNACPREEGNNVFQFFDSNKDQ
jgi:hypothetical protein